MYRKFWLVNSLNQKFEDMTARFQYGSPSGLGLQSNFTVSRLGNTELLISTERQLIEKGFELRFYGGLKIAYQTYLEFYRFAAKSPLYLYYQPPNLKAPLMCKVELAQLDKTEVDQDGVLRCTATFKPFTFWKDSEEHLITATRAIQEGGKHYKLERPYFYATSSLSNIVIYNDGIDNAPFEIEVVGESTDTQYNLYTGDGVKYGIGKFNGTFDRIYINSEDAYETIELEKNDRLLANPYNYQDIVIGEVEDVDVTFLKLKAGKNLLSFNMDNNFKGEINIRWRNSYATV